MKVIVLRVHREERTTQYVTVLKELMRIEKVVSATNVSQLVLLALEKANTLVINVNQVSSLLMVNVELKIPTSLIPFQRWCKVVIPLVVAVNSVKIIASSAILYIIEYLLEISVSV